MNEELNVLKKDDFGEYARLRFEEICAVVATESENSFKRKKALEEVKELLDRFITQSIEKYRALMLPEDFEDLRQDIYLHIIEKLPMYDPKRSKPVTYFNRLIRHVISTTSAKRKNSTPYYKEQSKKIKEVVTELESKGVLNPTPLQIARHGNLELETVINTLELSSNQFVEYQQNITESAINPLYVNKKIFSPEEEIEEKEKQYEIEQAVQKSLEPIDIFLFFSFNGIDREALRYKELAEMTGLTKTEIKKRLYQAEMNLRANPVLQKYGQSYISEAEMVHSSQNEQIELFNENWVDDLMDELENTDFFTDLPD